MIGGLGLQSTTATPLAGQRKKPDNPEFDVTAMVDLVFMMNIFFLVTWVGASLQEVDLPAAKHVVSTDPEECVIVTVLANAGGGTPGIVIGDEGDPVTDFAEIGRAVEAALVAGFGEGKTTLLIKAERKVPLRDVMRVGSLVGTVEGMKLRLAVMEKD